MRPIVVGEVLWKIAGKVELQIVTKDITNAELCLCSGQEEVIHTTYKIFDGKKTETIILVDAENVFNSVNRKMLVRNTENLFSELSSFICKCYIISERLFIVSSKEIRSREDCNRITFAIGHGDICNRINTS